MKEEAFGSPFFSLWRSFCTVSHDLKALELVVAHGERFLSHLPEAVGLLISKIGENR